jgi:hypothetical protein
MRRDILSITLFIAFATAVFGQNNATSGLLIQGLDTVEISFNKSKLFTDEGEILVLSKGSENSRRIAPKEGTAIDLNGGLYVSYLIDAKWKFIKVVVASGEIKLYESAGTRRLKVFYFRNTSGIFKKINVETLKLDLESTLTDSGERTTAIINKLVMPKGKVYTKSYLETLVLNYNAEKEPTKFKYDNSKFKFRSIHKLSLGVVESGFSLGYSFNKLLSNKIRWNIGLERFSYKTNIDPSELSFVGVFLNNKYNISTISVPVGLNYVFGPNKKTRFGISTGFFSSASFFELESVVFTDTGIKTLTHDFTKSSFAPYFGGSIESGKWFVDLRAIGLYDITTVNIGVGILL